MTAATNETRMTDYAKAHYCEINETYSEYDPAWSLSMDGDDVHEMTIQEIEAKVARVLMRAAQCLRNNIPATFTAGELDVVRHPMPAHEVHQSGAIRFVLDRWHEDLEEDEPNPTFFQPDH